MNQKTKNTLVWLVMNVGILSTFLYGNIYESAGILNVGIFGLWITSIVGLFGFSPKMATALYERDDWVGFSVPTFVDVSYDVLALICIVYFDYQVLAIFYFIHILAHQTLIQNINKLEKGEEL